MDYTMGHVASELGATFPAVEGTFIASSGTVIPGIIMEVDIDLDYGIDLILGSATSGLVKAEYATQNSTEAIFGGRVLVVAKTSARNGRPFRGCLQGMVPVLTGLSTTVGSLAILGSSNNDGKRVWGRFLESSAALGYPMCLWDGIAGFGQIVTADPGQPVVLASTTSVPIPPGPVDVPGGMVDVPSGGVLIPHVVEI